MTTQRLEDKEKGLQGAELEVASLNRYIVEGKKQCFFWDKEETSTGGISNKNVDNVEKVTNQESPTPRGRTRDL